jgi:hypothetical protein
MGLNEGGIHGDAYTLRVCPPHVFVLRSLVHTRPLCSSSPRPRRTWCPQSLRQPPRPATIYVHRLHLYPSCLTINPGYCALRACAVSSSLHRVAIPLCAIFRLPLENSKSVQGKGKRQRDIRIQRVSSACMNKKPFTSLPAESTLRRSAVDIHHARSPPHLTHYSVGTAPPKGTGIDSLSNLIPFHPCSSHPSCIPSPPAPSHPTKSCLQPRRTPITLAFPSPPSHPSSLVARRYATRCRVDRGMSPRVAAMSWKMDAVWRTDRVESK